MTTHDSNPFLSRPLVFRLSWHCSPWRSQIFSIDGSIVTEFGNLIGRFSSFETCFGLACIWVERRRSEGRSYGIGSRRQNSIALMAVFTRSTVVAIGRN